MRLFFVIGYVSIAVGVKESFTTWFFSVSRPQFSLGNIDPFHSG